MPADAPGATTDEQGSPPNGGGAPGDQSSSREASATSETGSQASAGTGGNGASSDRAGHTTSGGTTERDNRPTPGVREPGERSGAGIPTGGPGDGSAAGSATRQEGPAPGTTTEPGERPPSSAGAGSGAGATGELTVPVPASPPGAPPAQGPVPVPAGLPPGAEPPPAPVLVPPPSRLRGLRRGRHAPGRVDRAARRGLRVNQRLWSISPWSVFKVSALFYLCVALIVVVAGTLLYNVGRSVGTIDQFESFITRIGAYGECVPTAEVPKDAVFETDDKCDEGEVLVGGFAVDDGTLFRAAAFGAAILVVAGSIGNVLLTVLVNLLNELTGGVRHTIIREPVPRPPRPGPGRQGGPGRGPPAGAARPASGSPRPRLQR
jgi:hypothetical protein